MKFMRMSIWCLVMMACFLATEKANAFYNPQSGRWLNRDPVYEPGHQVRVQRPDHLAASGPLRPERVDRNRTACRDSACQGAGVGQFLLHQFCQNNPVDYFDLDGRDVRVPTTVKNWYKLQVGAGIAVLIVDSCILYRACGKLSVGEEAFVRTPGTRIISIPLNPVITLLCPEGGIVYYRVWKPTSAGCDNELVVFCFGSSPGGGGGGA